MKFLCALFLVCFVKGSLAQRIVDGQCPPVTAQPGVQNSQLGGTWVGGFKLIFRPTENTRCNYGCYKVSGNSLTITNKYVRNSDNQNGQNAPLQGTFTGDGKFQTTINGEIYNYTFLAFSEELGAASLYSCDNISKTQYRETAFGMSRVRSPSNDAVVFAMDGFTNQNINIDDVLPNDQADCPPLDC